MPRNRGPRKDYSPETGATPMMGESRVKLQNAGSRVAINIPPNLVGKGVRGFQVSTFRNVENVFTNRPMAISIPLGQSVSGWLTNTTTHAEATYIAEASHQRFSNIYYAMFDALVRQWQNSQQLQLTSIENFKLYDDLWNESYGKLRTMVSIINADNFNDRMSQLSQIGNALRTAIQANVQAFVQLPMCHGKPAILDRYFGCFTDDKGDDVIIGENFAPLDVTAADLTSFPVWQAAINRVAANITTMSSAANDMQIVRQVIAAYHGSPPPFLSSGVKRNSMYYNALRLTAMWKAIRVADVPTSRIIYPYIKLDSVGVPTVLDSDPVVPVIVPNGLENDPIMFTFLRPRVYGITNGGDLAGNLGMIGQFVVDKDATDATIRAYKFNDLTGIVEILGTPAYDALTQALADLYWSSPAGDEAPGYPNDHRSFEDWHRFETSIATMNAHTQDVLDVLWLEKATFPMVGGSGEFTAAKILRGDSSLNRSRV